MATQLAAELQFDEVQSGKVALIVTELATNLAKHTTGGELILRPLHTSPAQIEILALDRGPGIADVGRALEDGFSTAGSSGCGLGAVRRLADHFAVYSQRSPQASFPGTTIVARVLASSNHYDPIPTESVDVGAVCLPYPGEQLCGDSWDVSQSAGLVSIIVADGLGHGASAAAAADEAVRLFRANANELPTEIMGAVHRALRATRGAAVAVAQCNLQRREIRFVGIGNIAAAVIVTGEPNRRLVSHNGTAGYQSPKIQEFQYTWPVGGNLILHSDGLTSHWSLDAYPGLANCEPAIIAGTLYRDHRRGRDDATVLVLKDHG